MSTKPRIRFGPAFIPSRESPDAEPVVFYPGFLLGRERDEAIAAVVDQLGEVRERLEPKGRTVPFGLEIMGRVRRGAGRSIPHTRRSARCSSATGDRHRSRRRLIGSSTHDFPDASEHQARRGSVREGAL
jgi:hypothetical protein